MWKNSKIRIYILILFFIYPKLLFAESFNQIENFSKSKSFYDLLIPKDIKISIIGKEYIKFLKQIRDVGERQNLNSSLINFQKKKWIDVKIKSEVDNKKSVKAEIILHGDFNDHISLPYSSLRVKTKSNFFYQLKNFIFFKPKTRRYEAEIFGTLFLRNIGILSPYSRYVRLTINNNFHNNYIFQEKITKYFIERNGFREEPILEFDEKNKWNTYILNHPGTSSANFYKLENGNYANNQENIDKIFHAATLKQLKKRIKNYPNNLFEMSMLIMGGCHGLAEHNRKYYFDSLNDDFLPIYYDGMLFYDKSKNLCAVEREGQKIKITRKKYENFKKILEKDLFKDKLRNDYYELVNKKSYEKFDYFWDYLQKNLKNYKNLLDEKAFLIDDKNYLKEKISLKNKLTNLNLPYPTIYFYRDIKKKSYKMCYDWLDLSDKIYITNSKRKIFKKDQGCNKIEINYVKKLLKNKIYFKTNLNQKIKIYPMLIGNIYDDNIILDKKKLYVERINIVKDYDNKKFDLKSNTISIINFNKGIQIKNLVINSSDKNSSALVLYLNENKIGNIEFNQKNKFDQTLNSKIQKRNVNGCINIYNSKFEIDQIKINGSNCEDGLNIVRSSGTINNLKVIDAISDGIDFDYSKIQVNSSNFSNIGGDCIDLSFGEYKIERINIDGCGDKGVSAGENSIVTIYNSRIYNSAIGIASKDNSEVNIDNIFIKNAKNCLSAYNKKSEFGGGYINYSKMKCENFSKDIVVDNLSKIKNNNISK